LLLVRLSGQRASQNLDSSEKFSLGGPNSVRAYGPGEAATDDGNLVTLEYPLCPAPDWFHPELARFLRLWLGRL
jgi:hemolysin activation/secretion protein